MFEIIDQFRDRTTLDELGFGSIRDAFSDHFFPGISTIQTRARYLLFVPWVYLRIERERTPYSLVDGRARSYQASLVRALLSGGEGENDGVIGFLARDALKQTPAAIYWTGLRRFHIWQFPGSLGQYYAAAAAQSARAAATFSDDGEVVARAEVRGWHAGLPGEPHGLFDAAKFSLTSPEAEYLRERIVGTIPDSLLALCVESRHAITNIAYPWRHPDIATFPEQLQGELEQARLFSILALAAALLYNILIVRKATAAGLEVSQSLAEQLRALMAETAADREQLRGWQMTDLWSVVSGKGHTISAATREFVEKIVAILQEDPDAYVDDPVACALIERRELALKGGLAKLTHRSALEKSGGAAGLFALTYRWPNVQRIVGDIRAGLSVQPEPVLMAHA
jgi:hypothetical protein